MARHETEYETYWRQMAHAEQTRADRHEATIGRLKDELLCAEHVIAELRARLRKRKEVA